MVKNGVLLRIYTFMSILLVVATATQDVRAAMASIANRFVSNASVNVARVGCRRSTIASVLKNFIFSSRSVSFPTNAQLVGAASCRNNALSIFIDANNYSKKGKTAKEQWNKWLLFSPFFFSFIYSQNSDLKKDESFVPAGGMRNVRQNDNVVILPLIGNVFDASVTKIVFMLGLKATQFKWSNGIMPQDLLFGLCDQIAREEQKNGYNTDPVLYDGKMLPSIFKDWYEGKIEKDCIKKSIMELLIAKNDPRFNDNKALMGMLIDMLVDPEKYLQIVAPVNQRIEKIKELKQRGYKVVAFSNMASSNLKALQAQYPEVFGLFDETVYSCDRHAVTHDSKLLADLVTKLKESGARSCVLLHNEPKTISVAQQMADHFLRVVDLTTKTKSDFLELVTSSSKPE